MDTFVSMLEIVKKEMENETERKKHLEIRAGTVLGLMLTFATILVSTHGNVINKIMHKLYYELYSYVGFWSFVTTVIIVVAGKYYYSAIKNYCVVFLGLKMYAHVPCEEIIQFAYKDKNKAVYYFHVAMLIQRIVDENKKINDMKAIAFIKAGHALQRSVLAFMIWSFICAMAGF
ncbi:hypothetical protein [Selenomonas ruminantium]|uniref:hypothetical protein n=1 Tax=Selenomonas ruminantium TaxID=971 RepID=UPI0026EB752A|nr:hypothetical protein [Selenomonas ruminantium]